MVIAVFGDLTAGFTCIGPFGCVVEAVAHCGKGCTIMPIATFPDRNYKGPIVLSGNLLIGFLAYGPFADDTHAGKWQRDEAEADYVLQTYISLPLHSPTHYFTDTIINSSRGSD